jgi:hypothetical protein
VSGGGRRSAPHAVGRLPRTPSVPDPVDDEPLASDDDDLASRDPFGRMALFSSTESEPEPDPIEVLVLECSSCLAETPVSPFGLLRAALPVSVHLPLVKRYHSFIRCPACGRRTWLRVRLRR